MAQWLIQFINLSTCIYLRLRADGIYAVELYIGNILCARNFEGLYLYIGAVYAYVEYV